jgi:hypothetical protein
MSDEKGKESKGSKFEAGMLTGVVTMGAMAGIIAGLEAHNANPLRDAMQNTTKVKPDELAAEIAKDPKLQERWKAMRELVQSIDQQVGKNLEEGAGVSKDAAQHWQDRVGGDGKALTGHRASSGTAGAKPTPRISGTKEADDDLPNRAARALFPPIL